MEIRKYYLPTDGRTDRQTWVGARDTCVSKNNWGQLSSTFHVEQPETLIDWKRTWVGARDTCVYKNCTKVNESERK